MARQTGSNGENTARLIRAESLKLFARHGYAAVSMRQIADAVGVQASALYQYFENKQQLLVALLREHMEELLAALNAEPLDDMAPIAALEAFTRFHIRHHINRADAVFISYMELRALEPDSFREVEALRREYEGRLKAILVRGQKNGDFGIAEPHVAAMALLAMLTGVNTWYRSGGRLSQERIEDIYADMVLGSVQCAASAVAG